jgi:hypothetical protein
VWSEVDSQSKWKAVRVCGGQRMIFWPRAVRIPGQKFEGRVYYCSTWRVEGKISFLVDIQN